jgi:CheY-like chemotaxis protein
VSTGSVNKTILCIDDHLAGLEIRKRVLESRGFNILTASSGQAGLAMLDMSSVDAVLLDYKMEGMDGEAVATEIRRTKPSLPIVLLSGYPSEIPERMLQMVDAFVVKGQPVEALFTALDAVTGVLPENRKPVTDWAETLAESERLVKSARDTIAQIEVEGEKRKKAG